nr:MAG TPA: hypothetical protein [Caudoviricetes sp.]
MLHSCCIIPLKSLFLHLHVLPLKHQKPLKIKEKSNIFKGFQICRLRDLNPRKSL